MGETRGLIYFMVCQLHVEADVGVLDVGPCMTGGFQHGNILQTGVEDGFNLLIVVNEGQNGTECG